MTLTNEPPNYTNAHPYSELTLAEETSCECNQRLSCVCVCAFVGLNENKYICNTIKGSIYNAKPKIGSKIAFCIVCIDEIALLKCVHRYK